MNVSILQLPRRRLESEKQFVFKTDYAPKVGGKFTCKICGKQFKSGSGRYYHMAKHTGQYKMYCQMCDKGFMKRDEYDGHLRTHRKQIQRAMQVQVGK